MRDQIRNWMDRLAFVSDHSLDFCFFGAILLTAYYFLQWPIVAFDTDLWTHLNGGRYLIEHGRIPSTSFYSFISPQREIISYSWLFKALIYLIFRFSGYYGLIVFRTLICTATLTLVFLLLRSRRATVVHTAIFVLIFLLLSDSGSSIRPYNFSYLFIALFLYILECHRRMVFLLPAAAVLWVNIHGIEYPVMILIVFSYLAAYIRKRWQPAHPVDPPAYGYLVALALCAAAVFATPHGADLLGVPFTDTNNASQYINELRPPVLRDLLRFNLNGLAPDFATVYNLCVFTFTIFVLVRAGQRRIGLHHVVLFFAGTYLLTRGIRFIHEFALLSLPAIAAGDRQTLPRESHPARSPAVVAVIVAFLLVASLYMKNLYGNRPKYPLSQAFLPAGITAFLQHVGAKGRLLNDPATGGYLGWRTWPDCLIYMDMQVPFLFTDRDFFEGVNAIYDEHACRKLLKRYQPHFLSLPIQSPVNKMKMLAAEGYVPVFFDDREILYVQRELHPAIAKEHRLEVINPSAGLRIDFRKMMPEQKQQFLSEAKRLTRIYPESLSVNRLLSLYYVGQQETERAVTHAEQMIRNFPDHPEGYIQKASALKESKAYSQALKTYRRALKVADTRQQPDLFRSIGECYYFLGQYRKAYDAWLKDKDLFAPSTGSEDLYRLALAAYKAGNNIQARKLAKLAAFKQPIAGNSRDRRIDRLVRILEKAP